MTVHSKIGASSMYRWSVCPGSVRECALVDKKTSPYAEEGTLAHDVAATVLQGDGKILGKVSDEMREHVSAYVEFCEAEAKGATEVWTEHGFDLSEALGYPGLFGTADRIHYFKEKKFLQVIDLKYGAGIAVEVENNEQALYYALGALLSIKGVVEDVELVIYQPRCPHPDGVVRRWRFQAIEIFDFIATLLTAAKRTEDPNAPLVPGDHCRFCDASGTCPALKNKAQALAKLDFSVIDPENSPVAGQSAGELSKVLSWLPVLEGWIHNVREMAYQRAMKGQPPLGWKLVAKRATRKWKKEDPDEVSRELWGYFKIDKDEAFERKLRSPAQIEKLLPKDKNAKDLFSTLTISESSGLTLVHESDPRAEVKTETAKESFTVIEGELL